MSGDDDGDGPVPNATSVDLPHRNEFKPNPIDHATVYSGMSVGSLADEYGRAGVGAADLHEAIDIFTVMLDRTDVSVFMGLAGAMVPAGMRQIVVDLIRTGHIDALVTTGANLTHDAIEAIGGNHHHGRDGTPSATPREHDETLRDEWVDRIYNVYLPQEHFTSFEHHLRNEVFPNLERTVSIRELTAELGRANAEINKNKEILGDPGIAAAAYACDVPIYCPAVQDSILGIQAWMYAQTTAFSLDALSDMTHLNDLAYEADHTGAFLVGGGVPKNYVLQALLVTQRAYDYAVQLTMDPPQTGGLSGATLDEARSWGKIERTGQTASVYADATITFPLVVAAALERTDDS